MAEPGYVYVMTNPAMPGMVKIGKSTRSPEQRCTELSTTGVPLPFELAFAIFVPNANRLEWEAHNALQFCRVSPSREFFQTTADRAERAVLDLYLYESSRCTEALDVSFEAHSLAEKFEEATGEPCPTVCGISAAQQFTPEELRVAWFRHEAWIRDPNNREEAANA